MTLPHRGANRPATSSTADMRARASRRSTVVHPARRSWSGPAINGRGHGRHGRVGPVELAREPMSTGRRSPSAVTRSEPSSQA